MHFVIPALERAQVYQDEAVQDEEQGWGAGQEYEAVEGVRRRSNTVKAAPAKAPDGSICLAEGSFMLRKGLMGTVCVEIDGLNGSNMADAVESQQDEEGVGGAKSKSGGVLWWQFTTGGDAKTLNFFVVEGDFGSVAMDIQVSAQYDSSMSV
jgi:hypothetical protein